MQTTFTRVYQDIQAAKLVHMTGLWLIHGDDPLVLNWVIDACRPLFLSNQQMIKRITLDSPKRWNDVLAEIDSLSLFGDNSALIVSQKQKCDDAILSALDAFAEDASVGNSQHCLIYQLPKQDKKEQNTKLFKLFAQKGVVVDCHIYDEKGRAAILALKAQELNLSLDSAAWQCLLEHTEHNLLAAHQALWRASDLYPNIQTPLDTEALMPALVSDYHYSVFNLCDSILAGDVKKVMQILTHLYQTDTAPSVILWGIAKELRLLLQLQEGKSATELGIWQSKSYLYHTALERQRFSPAQLLAVYDIDKAIKGVNNTDAWHLLKKLILQLSHPALGDN